MFSDQIPRLLGLIVAAALSPISDAATGKARAVVSEEPKTFFNFSTTGYFFDGSKFVGRQMRPYRSV